MQAWSDCRLPPQAFMDFQMQRMTSAFDRPLRLQRRGVRGAGGECEVSGPGGRRGGALRRKAARTTWCGPATHAHLAWSGSACRLLPASHPPPPGQERQSGGPGTRGCCALSQTQNSPASPSPSEASVDREGPFSGPVLISF